MSLREERLARAALDQSDDSVMVSEGIEENLSDVARAVEPSGSTDLIPYMPGVVVPQRPPPETVKAVRAEDAGKFVGACVMSAKVVFGTPTDDRANRLVIRKFLRDLMEEHGMRPTHIMKYLDMTTELVFVPSASELHAARLRNSRAWRLRVGDYRRASSLGLRQTFWEFITRGATDNGRAA